MYDKTTVFLIVDAMRHDYLNEIDTPLLYSMFHEGVHAKRLVSSAGFTQRTAIFCGTKPDQSDNFTMYTFEPDDSPYRASNTLFARQKQYLSDLILKAAERASEGDGYPSKIGFQLMYALAKFLVIFDRNRIVSDASNYAVHAPVGAIPLHLLKFIGVSEDKKKLWEKDGLANESLFDKLIEANKSYQYLCYPVVDGDDESTLKAIQGAADIETDAYFIQFSESDSLMHKVGTMVEKRHAVMGEIDRKVRKINQTLLEKYNEVQWCIIGDHGMTDVSVYIDVQSKLKEINKRYALREGRDYVYFLDSTMLRVYYLNEKGKQLEKCLDSDRDLTAHATKMDDLLRDKYGIPSSEKYGHLIYWLDDNSIFYPDFFHDRCTKVLGMHGYESDVEDMMGLAVLYSTSGRLVHSAIENADLMDICPTLCDLIGVEYPKDNVGTSLLRNQNL